MRVVSVAGSDPCGPEEIALAEDVGRLLASQGVAVACGGRGGVMEAACRGAKAAGGTTIGILPGADTAGANAYVDLALPTGLGEGRNVLVAHAGEGLIAIGTGLGTLSEIAFAAKIGRRVASLHSWDLDAMRGRTEFLRVVGSAEEAVSFVLD